MEPEAKPRRGLRIDPSDLAVEIISIVVAILLALGVNSWHDSLKRHDDAVAGLRLIRREIVFNRAVLAPRLRHHREVAAAFGSLESRALRTLPHQVSYDAFWSTFRRSNHTTGLQPFLGDTTAWDLAHTTGTLANVDPATLAPLEIAYAEQAEVASYRDKLVADLHLVPSGGDNVFYALSGFVIDLGDLAGNETELMRRYGDALRALDRAGIH